MSVLDLFRLDGRTAVVTGASSGLGVTFARCLADAGASIAIGARRVEKLQSTRELLEKSGARTMAMALDVVDPESCSAFVQSTVEYFGSVDILVNNAGIATAFPSTSESPDDFRRVLEVNLNGSYWMAQACGRTMGPGSSIVNVSSILGVTTAGLPQAAYSASKAGIIGLTRDLAQQWSRRKGIRVNAIAPGFFESEMTDEYQPGYLERQTERLLIPRLGDPEELGATLVWLTSDAGGYVTGQTIVVDGGFTIT